MSELPNILITGTPGAGKSFLCERLSKKLNFNWIDCSKLAKENGFIEKEYDETYDCPVLDEEQLMDYMEPIMQNGGNVVEYHSCEFFPERWFQAVFVVTCSNTILHDRLTERGYNKQKLKSNLECEIFGTIYEEAIESYNPNIVFKLSGETLQNSEDGIQAVCKWLCAWKRK